MAEDTQETGQTQATQKSGKGKTLIIVVLLVLLIASCVGGFLLWRQRAAAVNAKPAEAAKHNDHKSEGESDEGDVKEVVELQPFIVNLADRDEPRYLRMTISLGLGEGDEKPDPLFTTKVRNAILAVVTNKKSEDILTVEGKTALRKEMLSAARSAIGKPSVQAIYITDFIVQM